MHISVPLGTFCVYAHEGDNGIFYIGSGTLSRPFVFTSRPPMWHAEASKNAKIKIHILGWFSTLKEARVFEFSEIKRIRPCANIMGNVNKKRKNKKTRQVAPHIKEEITKLVWQLKKEGYSYTDIAYIMNVPHHETIRRIVNTMPQGWEPKWVKTR